MWRQTEIVDTMHISFWCLFTLAGRPEWIRRQPRRCRSRWRGREEASAAPSLQWWMERTSRGSLRGRQGSSSCRRCPPPSWTYFVRGRSSTWTPSCCQDVYFEKEGKLTCVCDCQCLSSKLARNCSMLEKRFTRWRCREMRWVGDFQFWTFGEEWLWQLDCPHQSVSPSQVPVLSHSPSEYNHHAQIYELG